MVLFLSVQVLVWCQSKFGQTGAFQTLCGSGSSRSPAHLLLVSLFLSVVYQKDLTAYILRVPFKSFQCLQYFVSCQSNVLKRCQPWMWWPRRPLWSHVGVTIQLRSTRYRCATFHTCHICFFCCLLWYLNTDTARIISHLFFNVHLNIFIRPFLCFYISLGNFYFVFSCSFYSVHTWKHRVGKIWTSYS